MKQANAFLPVYTADNSAMCSALYELGGLLVMHDASGCNSTYTTHDEPRWFDRPAQVYITGLTEIDAVLGNEQRMIDDIVDAARELTPHFIAIAGTPIPMMMGTDYDGIAREIEAATGIISFGIDTNGTHDYVSGADKAFAQLADRFCTDVFAKTDRLSVNLLGVTPLDFSINGTHADLRRLFEDNGIDVVSCWAMDDELGNITRASSAHVNVVVSSCGLSAARLLATRFGMPYVVGCPVGRFMTDVLLQKVREAAEYRECFNLAVGCRGNDSDAPPSYVIGEPVIAAAVRASLVRDAGLTNVRVLTSLTCDEMLLAPGDRTGLVEDDYLKLLPEAGLIVADPLYRTMLQLSGKTNVDFAEWPHEAFSGRIWREHMPHFIGDAFNRWFHDRANTPSLTGSLYKNLSAF